ARDFFMGLEKTEISRSYKIVLLLAMLDGETLITSLSIEEITRRVAALTKRMHRVAEDFSVDLSDTEALQKLLVDNPIEAFIRARGMGGVSYFKFEGQTFAFTFEIPKPIIFGALLREILDWRTTRVLASFCASGIKQNGALCFANAGAFVALYALAPARTKSGASATSSAAYLRHRTASAAPQPTSIFTLRPTIQSSCCNLSIKTSRRNFACGSSSAKDMSTPIRRILSGCCARAASGHEA